MISKSQYKKYLDSPRHFWALKHNQYNEIVSDFAQHLIKTGYEVEETSKEYIAKHISDSFEYQKKLSFEDLECIIDFLVLNTQTGRYCIYEVKSSTKLSEEYLYDLGFQYIIASQFFDIDKLNLVHLDNEYIREQDLDLAGAFRVQDITEKVLEKIDEIKKDIEIMREIEKMDEYTSLDICYKLKTCPCKELCFPNLVENSIYSLANIHHQALVKLKESNIESMLDIPDTFKLGRRQRLQIDSLRKQQPIINLEAIKNEFKKLKQPLYFLDYEAFSWAIPKYKGHKVYQNIVFQYSLHKINSEDNSLIHYEYISENKEDITKDLIPNLLNEIGDSGTILVWNKSFEKSCNREMARLYPEYKNRLLDLNNRMYDLGDIFSKQYYVDYRFHGSWSIKNILPVLVPNLNYKLLKEIHDGTEAMQGWYELVFTDTKNKEELKNNLLRYCELDTLAMYEIYKFLLPLI